MHGCLNGVADVRGGEEWLRTIKQKRKDKNKTAMEF